MNKLKWILGGLFLIAVPLFAVSQLTHAQRFATNVDEDQVVHGSLYSAGRNITIKGEVFGDVFCAGQTVKVDAIVHGDVICAGQDLTINGKIDGDIRAAGQEMSVNAEATGSMTLAGSRVSLDAEAKLGRDLTATGQELNIKGQVGRDAVLSGTKVAINGPIARNVTFKGDTLQLKSDAKVSGDLNYTSAAIGLDAGAKVDGKTTERHEKQSSKLWFDPMFYLFALLGLVLVSGVLALVVPKFLDQNADIIKRRPLRTLLVGFAASLVIPAAVVLLALTLVGIPLALLILLAGLLMAMLTGPIVGFQIGRLLIKRGNIFPMAVVGGALLVTAYFLPYIGLGVMLATTWLGTGALLTSFATHSQLSSEKS
jgi:cytoskeletal protein CcmA (bactofilin family)